MRDSDGKAFLKKNTYTHTYISVASSWIRALFWQIIDTVVIGSDNDNSNALSSSNCYQSFARGIANADESSNRSRSFLPSYFLFFSTRRKFYGSLRRLLSQTKVEAKLSRVRTHTRMLLLHLAFRRDGEYTSRESFVSNNNYRDRTANFKYNAKCHGLG